MTQRRFRLATRSTGEPPSAAVDRFLLVTPEVKYAEESLQSNTCHRSQITPHEAAWLPISSFVAFRNRPPPWRQPRSGLLVTSSCRPAHKFRFEVTVTGRSIARASPQRRT
jgi:hypothetical protein